jgi:hypothetical protein
MKESRRAFFWWILARKRTARSLVVNTDEPFSSQLLISGDETGNTAEDVAYNSI